MPLRALVDLGVLAMKGWLHMLQNSWIGDSPSDAAWPSLFVSTFFIVGICLIYQIRYEDHSINKANFASGVGYRKHCLSFTLFKEINSDRSFHILQDWQHDFLYWPPRPDLFLYQKVSKFLLHRLSFRLMLVNSEKTFTW